MESTSAIAESVAVTTAETTISPETEEIPLLALKEEKTVCYSEFSDIIEMMIYYPTGDVEIVKWKNGVSDSENSTRGEPFVFICY